MSAVEAERIALEKKQEHERQERSDAAQARFDAAFDAAHKKQAEEQALAAVDKATPVIAAAEGKVDTSALSASVVALTSYEVLEPGDVYSLAEDVDATIPAVEAAVAEADRIAAERAAQIAAQRATPEGAKALAIDMMAAKYGWGGSQATCLINLWQKESGWRYDAVNRSSGATGIPQSLPGSKMATHGADWQTNPATQISWGLDYIKRAYGTPCGAWGHSQAQNWY